MVTLIDTVPEAITHIILPCAKQILKKIVDDIGMHPYIGDHIFITSETLRIGSSTDKDKNPALPHDRVEARMVPIFTPVNNKWDAGQAITLIDNKIVAKGQDKPYDRLPFNPEANTAKYPIFWDRFSRTSLVEDTIPAAFTLELNWRMTEMTNAAELMSRLLSVYTNGEMITDVDFVYDYPVPKPILATMLGIARLRGVADEEFVSYVHKLSKGIITVNRYREMVGGIELVVNRNHANTIFQIEMGQEGPTMNGTYFDISSTVTVALARANQMILTYPLTVNNYAIPRSLVPKVDEERYKADMPVKWDNKALDAYYHHLYPDNNKFVPYQCPWYDDWKLPPSSKPGQIPYILVASALLTLDDIEDPLGTTSVDLDGDLPNCEINPEVLDKIRAAGDEALHFNGEYGVGIFADDLQVNPSLISIDGTVVTFKSRRVDRTYRLVLCKRKGEANGGCTITWSGRVTVRPTRD